MARFIQYFGQFNSMRQRYGGLPGWAKGVVLVAMVPGLIIAALSVLVLVVSMFVLLLLAVPAYRLMQVVAGSRESSEVGPVDGMVDPFAGMQTQVHEPDPSPRRHINVRIVE